MGIVFFQFEGGIVCTSCQEVVLLEDFDKLTHVSFGRGPVDPKLVRKFFSDFGFRRSMLQEFQDSRSDKIEAEHLSVEDVENGRAVGAVGRTHMLLDPEQVLLLAPWLGRRKFLRAI
jgi:hypothetical protein